MDAPRESRRESALTVRREARPFYAALFVLQTFGLVARRFYIALMERLEAEPVSFWQALSAAIDEGKLLDIAAVGLSELERHLTYHRANLSQPRTLFDFMAVKTRFW